MYSKSKLRLPAILYVNRAQKCIGCSKFLHRISNSRIRIDNNTWSNQGYTLCANKISNIFAHHRILIHHCNDLICINCNQQDIKDLNIESIDVNDSTHLLSSYNRSLIYISQRLIKKPIVDTNDNIDNKTEMFDENMNTNRQNNNIKYELLSNNDCVLFCRLNKHQIKELSQLYDIPEQHLFYFFARYGPHFIFLILNEIMIAVYTLIYRCKRKLCYRLQGVMFGYSYQYMNNVFINTLNKLSNNFVNDNLGYPCWDRLKISTNTSSYCNELLSTNDHNIAVTMDSFGLYITKSHRIELMLFFARWMLKIRFL